MTPLVAVICVALSQPVTDYFGDSPDLRTPKPTIPSSAATATGFVPRSWTLERAITGDLNRDGRPDLVAVLKGADPICVVRIDDATQPMDTNPRVVLVAFGGPNGYHLQLVNAAVIPRIDDRYMDDPFDPDALTIRGDVLRLGLRYWRSMGGWTTFTSTLAFRWDGTRFRLIGFDKESLQRNSGETETVSANFVTGRVKTVTGSMEDDVGSKTRWQKLRQAPTNLETIGDGFSFELPISGH
ncbi:hypothetical protein Q5H91_07430 [Sphingomonas sp. KR1UV-12]|uniref:VCBS repeat-containing protein n=1 Tax=Sphingomonas aurea TaxID=3063994 RepID=A0ABT9EK97_9SPHN|nr:hypothetical protein [Sphingomonas sp. KR1UV-12]MDP1027038.1 hypothetical protein [Sphingomonas sp. KR1UV-12]